MLFYIYLFTNDLPELHLWSWSTALVYKQQQCVCLCVFCLLIDALSNTLTVFVDTQHKGMNARNEEMIVSKSRTEDFFRFLLCVSWLHQTQNSCRFKRNNFLFFVESGWTFCRGEAELSFTSSPIVPSRRNGQYLFSMFIINMFSSVWRPNGETHWAQKWKRSFSLLLSPFFSVTMMLQVPWGSQGPTGGSKGTVNKEHFSCMPVVPSDSSGAKQRPT